MNKLNFIIFVLLTSTKFVLTDDAEEKSPQTQPENLNKDGESVVSLTDIINESELIAKSDEDHTELVRVERSSFSDFSTEGMDRTTDDEEISKERRENSEEQLKAESKEAIIEEADSKAGMDYNNMANMQNDDPEDIKKVDNARKHKNTAEDKKADLGSEKKSRDAENKNESLEKNYENHGSKTEETSLRDAEDSHSKAPVNEYKMNVEFEKFGHIENVPNSRRMLQPVMLDSKAKSMTPPRFSEELMRIPNTLTELTDLDSYHNYGTDIIHAPLSRTGLTFSAPVTNFLQRSPYPSKIPDLTDPFTSFDKYNPVRRKIPSRNKQTDSFSYEDRIDSLYERSSNAYPYVSYASTTPKPVMRTQIPNNFYVQLSRVSDAVETPPVLSRTMSDFSSFYKTFDQNYANLGFGQYSPRFRRDLTNEREE